MDVGGCIWVRADVGGVLGGLEEDWRRVAGALEEPWRRMDPRSMAWVRPSMGIMSRPLGKITFFCQNDVFLTIFPLGRSNCLQITKNNFSRFLAFYPLISAFHALWRSF